MIGRPNVAHLATGQVVRLRQERGHLHGGGQRELKATLQSGRRDQGREPMAFGLVGNPALLRTDP